MVIELISHIKYVANWNGAILVAKVKTKVPSTGKFETEIANKTLLLANTTWWRRISGVI